MSKVKACYDDPSVEKQELRYLLNILLYAISDMLLEEVPRNAINRQVHATLKDYIKICKVTSRQ